MKSSLTKLYFVLTLFWSGTASGQDIHFSHIHASPMVLNPALTGVFEGDARIIANYRSQWKSVTANYRTYAFSADANLPGVNDNSVLGIGVQVYADVAGDIDLSITQSSLSLSVMQSFNSENSHILAGGVNIGNISTRFDPSKIVAFEPEPLYEKGGTNRLSYGDISAGLLWFRRLRKTGFIYTGVGFHHLSKPPVSFYRDVRQISLHRRWVVHGGANVRVNKVLTLVPNFIVMHQGPHQQITLGSFVRYLDPATLKKGMGSFMVGGWIRTFRQGGGVGVDALVMAIRSDYNNLTFTFTYDINISSLSRVSFGRGGPELSLIYLVGSSFYGTGDRPRRVRKKSGIKCPVF